MAKIEDILSEFPEIVVTSASDAGREKDMIQLTRWLNGKDLAYLCREYRRIGANPEREVMLVKKNSGGEFSLFVNKVCEQIGGDDDGGFY